MKRTDLGQAINTIANIGVIAGIVFLAVELQQNTAAIQGATYQGLSDSASDQLLRVTDNPQLADVLFRAYSGADWEDLEPSENFQLFTYYRAHLQRLENSYFQFSAGLVDEVVFESYGWNDRLLNSPHFRRFLQQFGENGLSLRFREFLDNRLSAISVPQE